MKKFTSISLLLIMSFLTASAQTISIGAGCGYSRIGKTGSDDLEAFYHAFNRAQIIADFMFNDEWGMTLDIGAGRAFKHKGVAAREISNFTGVFLAPFYEFRIGRSFFLDLGLGLAYKYTEDKDQQTGDHFIHAIGLGLEPSFGYEINDNWEVFINNRWDADFYNSRFKDFEKGLWGGYHLSLGISYSL